MQSNKQQVEVSPENKKAGVIGLIIIIVILVLVGWWISSLLSGGDNADTNDSSESIVKVVADIEGKSNGGICTYSDEQNGVGMSVSNALTNFVNITRALDSSKCESFSYGLFIDSSSVMTLRVDSDNRPSFDKYNWDNIKNDSIGDDLQRDGILTKFDTQISGINKSSVRYTGKSDDLK